MITQAENCFGVLSAVALFEINHRCDASLLNTDMQVKARGQQQIFGCSDLQDIQVLLTVAGWFSHRLWRNPRRAEAAAELIFWSFVSAN